MNKRIHIVQGTMWDNWLCGSEFGRHSSFLGWFWTAAFRCWTMAVRLCDIACACCDLTTSKALATCLQACTPSTHVCSKFESPISPHFLNQEPPRPQQLSLPDFFMVVHLGHRGPIVVTLLVDTGRCWHVRVGQTIKRTGVTSSPNNSARAWHYILYEHS